MSTTVAGLTFTDDNQIFANGKYHHSLNSLKAIAKDYGSYKIEFITNEGEGDNPSEYQPTTYKIICNDGTCHTLLFDQRTNEFILHKGFDNILVMTDEDSKANNFESWHNKNNAHYRKLMMSVNDCKRFNKNNLKDLSMYIMASELW